jgi:hypothetical protein
MVGQTLTLVLNGHKIIDNFQTTGPTAGALDPNVDAPGPIMLQGDHSSIDFRNIFIRPL